MIDVSSVNLVCSPVSLNFVANPVKVRIATSGSGATCEEVRNGGSRTYPRINPAIHARER